MKNSKGKHKIWFNAGAALRVTLVLGVWVGVVLAKPGRPEYLSFSEVLDMLERQTERGGSANRDASVDYLRHSGNVPVTCRSRGLCRCYSKALRRSFCCDCLNGPCFPAEATVLTPKGEVAMGDLSVGDTVLAGSESGVGLIWSPVIAWLDRRPEEEAQYLSISTEGGPSLLLSSSHLLFTAKGDNILPKFAGEVSTNEALLKITDKLTHYNASANLAIMKTGVTNITTVLPVIMKGAYVPLTQTGTIFVNGILASCYASVTHDIAHVALAPVRWAPSWMNGGQFEGTMPYVRLLKWLAPWVLAARDLGPKDTSVVVERVVDENGLVCPHFLNVVSNIMQVFITTV